MKKTCLLVSVVLAATLLLALVPFSVFALTVPTFSLSESSYRLQYVLPAGTTFNGSIATTGSVRFWVSDPNMAQIVNLGIIDNADAFSFVAKQNGTYTFNFENDLPNTIQVSFSYVTNPTIPGGGSSGIVWAYLVIFVVVAVVGSVVIIFVIRRTTKMDDSGDRQV